MRTIGLLVGLWCVGVGSAAAQTAAPAAAPPAQAAGSAQAQAKDAPAQPAPAVAGQPVPGSVPDSNYTYSPDGRRDPFLNLLGQGAEPAVGRRGEGAAGLAVAEISVRGVVLSRGELLAMIQGPEGKTYIVHQGDKFVDGTVRSVTPQGLIIVQDVNDPLSLVKQREIQKLLRSQDIAKE